MLIAPPPKENSRPRFVVTLFGTEKLIEVQCVKHDDVSEILRGFGLSWSRPSQTWQREIDKCAGPAADRLAEIGVSLLLNQFHVELPDEAGTKIIDRSWEVEHKRWVNVCLKGNFVFRWERNGSIYYQIKKIPGAKYENQRIYVPADMYEYVSDFAEANNFRFTNPAKNRLEELKNSLPLAISISAELLAPKPPVPVVVEVPTVEEVYSEFAD